MSRKSYLNAGKMTKMCRVCMTLSNNVMYDLTDDIALDNTNEMPILEALEKIVSVKVLLDEDFPQYICPICMSILKMALKFVSQFEETQKKLLKIFDKCPTYEPQEDNVQQAENNPMNTSIKEEDCAPVEIIFGHSKFDLKDVVVVEEAEKDEYNYKAFLKNLGREVSATFADKFVTKPKYFQAYEENAVSIYMKDNENGILPVRELKIDDDTNFIDYIIVENSQSDVEDTMEEVDLKPEYIEFETLNEELDSSIAEGKSDNEEGNRIEYLIDEKDIDSLIIQATENDDEINKENNRVKKPRAQKVVKATKRKKEEESKDVVIMGPINGEVKQLNVRDEEDDIFEREIQFPCEICKKIFSNTRALRAHKRRTHFPKEQQFSCEICGYKNKTRSGYVHHKNKHIGKQFTCEICSKTYYTRAVLKVHMATHVNKRQHLCNVCGKGFNYPNALIYHMRLHTGERNYNCEYCGEKFRMPNSLKRHVRIHTGERPYRCRFCDRGFCSRGEVQCHENIHTGYRPYHCKHCLKGFTKTHNLKLHLLKHEGPHGCDICGKSFIEMSILSMHYKIAHKDLLETNKEDVMIDEQD